MTTTIRVGKHFDEATRGDLLSNVQPRPQLMSDFNVKTDTRADARTQPTGIAITSSGEYIVADYAEKKVKVFNKTGHIKTELGRRELKAPWDVALLLNGNVVVTDPGDHKVKIFSPRGDLLRSFSCCGGMTEPYGVTVNKHGQILVADRTTKSIYIHSPGGARLGWVTPQCGARSLVWPQYICTDNKGDIVVSDTETHIVQCINQSSGERVWMYGGVGRNQGQVLCPQGVCVDAGGHVIIADGGNNRIHVASSNGRYLKTLLSSKERLVNPLAMCLDNAGNLVVTEGTTGETKSYSYIA